VNKPIGVPMTVNKKVRGTDSIIIFAQFYIFCNKKLILKNQFLIIQFFLKTLDLPSKMVYIPIDGQEVVFQDIASAPLTCCIPHTPVILIYLRREP
jgi:hypothetical protein